jgi:hypothetical protein
MKVKAPKCPACGRWMYIGSDESDEERVDVAPTVEIYWMCDCGRADNIPLKTISHQEAMNVHVLRL